MTPRQIITFGTAALLLSGCGISETRLNPFNWFGSDEDTETVEDVTIVESREVRPLIAQVTSVVLEETPGGVIIRATGLPPEQGWHNAALVSETRGRPVNGVLTLAFRAVPPTEAQRVSTVQSREIVVGRFVSNITLNDVREIRIVGEQNSRVSRR